MEITVTVEDLRKANKEYTSFTDDICSLCMIAQSLKRHGMLLPNVYTQEIEDLNTGERYMMPEDLVKLRSLWDRGKFKTLESRLPARFTLVKQEHDVEEY